MIDDHGCAEKTSRLLLLLVGSHMSGAFLGGILQGCFLAASSSFFRGGPSSRRVSRQSLKGTCWNPQAGEVEAPSTPTFSSLGPIIYTGLWKLSQRGRAARISLSGTSSWLFDMHFTFPTPWTWVRQVVSLHQRRQQTSRIHGDGDRRRPMRSPSSHIRGMQVTATVDTWAHQQLGIAG